MEEGYGERKRRKTFASGFSASESRKKVVNGKCLSDSDDQNLRRVVELANPFHLLHFLLLSLPSIRLILLSPVHRSFVSCFSLSVNAVDSRRTWRQILNINLSSNKGI
jgi:hypothetical protein